MKTNNGNGESKIEILRHRMAQIIKCKDEVIPDSPDNLESFYQDEPLPISPKGYSGWNVNQYGYIAWSDVEAFCVENKMNDALGVFKYNQGQLY